YDGLQQALQLFAPAAPAGKGAKAAAESTLPVDKAIVVISDGRDNGSATDEEKIISDANKRKIPIHAVGHSQLDQDTLQKLETLAHRAGGTYQAAPTPEEISSRGLA